MQIGVPKFVLNDNGGEWAGEFDVMCRDWYPPSTHNTPMVLVQWEGSWIVVVSLSSAMLMTS
jgi:hypothetical protein